MIGIISLVCLLLYIVLQEIKRRGDKKWRNLSRFPGDFPLPLIGNALSLCFNVTVLVLLGHKFIFQSGPKWRMLEQFPCDPPLPFVGNAMLWAFNTSDATKVLLDMWKRHGQTNFRVSVGSEDWVLLTEPDDVGVLFSDSTILSKSPERNAAVKPFFGESVSTSEGERWRWARKLLLPSFHTKNNSQRLDTVNEKSELLIKMLEAAAENGPVPLYYYLRPYMLDIIFKTLMGVESNFLYNLDHPYIVDSGKVINIITTNFFSYWRNIRPIFVLTPIYQNMMSVVKTIKNTAKDVIEERKLKIAKEAQNVDNNNKASDVDIKQISKKKIAEENTLIDAFFLKTLPNGEPIPEDIINEEISFVYFTGHFTTAVTISHTLYCIAKHPEVQKRVIEEQRSIFNSNYLRKPNMEDLNEMRYLEAVIKETLRMIPTVPKIGRNLKKDLTLKDGRVIPAGSTAIIFYEAMFMDEKQFKEPQKFNPERFFEGNIHPHAFLPFGGGPRSCIGFRFAWMTIKATLSNILRDFEVSVDSGLEPQFSYGVVTESTNGINLVLNKRNICTKLRQCKRLINNNGSLPPFCS